jgi:myo-inositol-1(or 4)-monophosphatase
LHSIKNIKLLNFFKKYKNFFKINSADAYNYCLLSEGKVDVVIEAGLKPFDIEPLVPIIKNAGGIVSNWHGGDDISKGSVVVSCNKVIHSKILNLLRKFI